MMFKKSADFGSFTENDEVVIPTTGEMINEFPARVALLLEVLDFKP